MGRIHYSYRIAYPSGRVYYTSQYPLGPLPDDAGVWQVTYNGNERVDFQKLFVVNGELRRQPEPMHSTSKRNSTRARSTPAPRRRHQTWVDWVVIISRILKRR